MASPATAVRLWRAFPKPMVVEASQASVVTCQAKKDKGKRKGTDKGQDGNAFVQPVPAPILPGPAGAIVHWIIF